MRALLQRVIRADVRIDDIEVARIGSGLLVLLGVYRTDTEANVSRLADKVLAARVFRDEEKLMQRSVLDVGGDILVVSQFTLAADTRKGNRPSFTPAAPPDIAEPLYERFVAALRAKAEPKDGIVATGRFGADMQVGLVNDGPVTLLLDV